MGANIFFEINLHYIILNTQQHIKEYSYKLILGHILLNHIPGVMQSLFLFVGLWKPAHTSKSFWFQMIYPSFLILPYQTPMVSLCSHLENIQAVLSFKLHPNHNTAFSLFPYVFSSHPLKKIWFSDLKHSKYNSTPFKNSRNHPSRTKCHSPLSIANSNNIRLFCRPLTIFPFAHGI